MPSNGWYVHYRYIVLHETACWYDSGNANTAGSPSWTWSTSTTRSATRSWRISSQPTTISSLLTGVVSISLFSPFFHPSFPHANLESNTLLDKGSAGHVAINNADSPWQATFSTDMADGPYCDVVNGYRSGTECTGTTYVLCISPPSFSSFRVDG